MHKKVGKGYHFSKLDLCGKFLKRVFESPSLSCTVYINLLLRLVVVLVEEDAVPSVPEAVSPGDQVARKAADDLQHAVVDVLPTDLKKGNEDNISVDE